MTTNLFTDLQQQFDDQHFTNEYQLVNGVLMHSENPDNIHVPPQVIKRLSGPASSSNSGLTHHDSLFMKTLLYNVHVLPATVN